MGIKIRVTEKQPLIKLWYSSMTAVQNVCKSNEELSDLSS